MTTDPTERAVENAVRQNIGPITQKRILDEVLWRCSSAWSEEQVLTALDAVLARGTVKFDRVCEYSGPKYVAGEVPGIPDPVFLGFTCGHIEGKDDRGFDVYCAGHGYAIVHRSTWMARKVIVHCPKCGRAGHQAAIVDGYRRTVNMHDLDGKLHDERNWLACKPELSHAELTQLGKLRAKIDGTPEPGDYVPPTPAQLALLDEIMAEVRAEERAQ